jgi:hypothetical protein
MLFSYKMMVCRDGYEFRTVSTPRSALRTVLSAGAPYKVVARLGDQFIEPAPDAFSVPCLYLRLAGYSVTPAGAPKLARPMITEQGILDFVTRFGFLGKPRDRSETLDSIIHEIRALRSVIEAAGLVGDHPADWGSLRAWIEENKRAVRLSPELVDAVGRDRLELSFGPSDLRSAIYLQLLQDVTRSKTFKICANPSCPNWFYYGPGTDHRKTAEYCSPKCQKAHAYLQTKRG